jgi:hypothetical protein
VPNIQTRSIEESREFYTSFLGFQIEMDMGWIVTFVSGANPTAQLSVITSDLTAPVHPDLTIGVENVDDLYAEAVRCGAAFLSPIL